MAGCFAKTFVMSLLVYLPYLPFSQVSGRKYCIDFSRTNLNFKDLGGISVRLSCRKDSLIFDPRIKGVKNLMACKAATDNSTCNGLTAESLADAYDCFWRETCNVRFPAHQFLLPPKATSCTGKTEAIHLQWSCINTRMLRVPSENTILMFDISNTSTEKIGPPQSKSKYGIIRSHKLTPWNYDDSLFLSSKVIKDDQFETIKVFNVTFESSLSYSSTLSITAWNVELDKEAGESLRLVHKKSNGSESVDVTKTNLQQYLLRPGDTVDLIFQRRFQKEEEIESYGGMGFVLCFKVSKGERDTVKNVCRKLMRARSKTPKVTKHQDGCCPRAKMRRIRILRCNKKRRCRKIKRKKTSTWSTRGNI